MAAATTTATGDMAFLSYAQNAEDVVLARAFRGVTDGYYVDVGAGHPVWDSVTKHFYDIGWRGVNVEPLAEEGELLRRERPDDVNIQMALSDRPGEIPIFVGPPENRGSSTVSGVLAASYRQLGQEFVERTVPVTTLGAVLEEHVDRQIDFLKVDVEGHEAKVLGGVDLARWRPRVMVIEATRPNSPERCEQEWEPLVLSAGYTFALFDGLNRFYVRDEDGALISHLSAPANTLDGFVPYRFHAEIGGLRENLETTTRALHHAATTYQDVQDARAESEKYTASLEGRVSDLELQLHGAEDEVSRLADQLARIERAAESARRVGADEAKRRIEAEQGRGAAELASARLEQSGAALEQSRVHLEQTCVHLEQTCALLEQRCEDAEQERAELAKILTTKTFRYLAAPRAIYGKVFRKWRRAGER